MCPAPGTTRWCGARLFVACTLICAFCPAASAYAVLTHEAIIDSAWGQNIRPLLLARFPNATPAQLLEAHAYAYGGCIVQDMGYYPFGSKFFSDLLHYVRTGDFVANLIKESRDLDEYAFALGALAHYAADTEGHSIAVNHSVPVAYPHLRRKYGAVVTYEDDPAAHLKVEFGFDVLQIARGDYAPQSFHDFIGFQVSKDLLERAFHDTYSLDLSDVFSDIDLALGTYRHTVSALLPSLTRAAWSARKKELKAAKPGITRRRFIYNLSRASYHKNWDRNYRQPGIGARILGFLLRILPKIGPLKALQFPIPTQQTERLFEMSFDRTLDMYRGLLAEQAHHQLALGEEDLDTGKPTKPDEYKLCDNTYAQLAIMLAKRDPANIDPAVRRSVLAFFGDLNQPYATKRNKKEWTETEKAVEKLQAE